MLIHRNFTGKLFAAALLASVVFPAQALAQASVDSGVIDRPTPQVEVPQNFQLNQQKAAPLQDAPEIEPVANPDEVFATLSHIQFEGNTKVKEEQLQVIAAPYINRPITNRDLAEFKYRIAQEYYRRGFTLVKAVTPQQSLSGGVLQVRVVEALVGNVNIQKNEALNPYVANAFAGRVTKGAVFHEQDAESLVSDINDIKNVNATLNLAPGKEFSTTDFNVFIEPVPGEDENFVTVDNYGAELTGEYIGRVHLEKSNLLKFGERVYVDGRISDDELYSGGGGIDVPVGYKNVYFHTSYNYTQNDIGDPLENLGINGNSSTFDLSLSSALLNTRDEKVNLRGGLESRSHESEASDITQWQDEIRQAYLDGSYLYRGESSVWYASVRVSRGLDTFGASDNNFVPQPSDSARSRLTGDQEAFIVRPTFLVNYQPTDVPVLQDGRFEFFTTGQLASQTLLSSDLFVLGGYGSVRGFEPALATGEAGWQFNAEYQQDLPVHPDWVVSVGPWMDGGMVLNRVASPANGVADRDLYSVGLGAEATSELLKGIGDTRLRVDWAHPVGHYKTPGVDDDTFYFRLSQFF